MLTLKGALCVALAFVLVVACARTEGVSVTLDEYSIDLEPPASRPGRVVMNARNTGRIAHQLIILRTDLPANELPVKGGVVQVDREGIREIDRIALLAAGDAETLTVRLRPGNHVLICNIAGHYDNGMMARFQVR